jgi:hypothetical protein
MQAEYWRELWDYLQLRLLTFRDVGLSADDPDSVVWRRCQEQSLYLLTNNRNDDGPDSLEATIRAYNTEECIPVFTIGVADRLLLSKEYLEEVVESLFDQLLRIDTLRGAGRLFLP